MLEKLDTVPWDRLRHAYGSASDVPDQLRMLASGDPAKFDEAMVMLYVNIFHQGTRYSAAPYAIPFLFEILEVAGPRQSEIVELLVSLAIGYEESYLPEGVDPAELRQDVHRIERDSSDAALKYLEDGPKFGFGPRVDVRCYDAVRTHLEWVIPLLSSSEPNTRRAAAHLTAWFPEEAGRTVPALCQYLTGSTEPIDIAHAALAIGLLSRSGSEFRTDTVLAGYLSHPSLLVRTSTAIALAHVSPTDPIIDVLVFALGEWDELQAFKTELYFNEGDLPGYVSLVLARIGIHSRERIVPALCAALKGSHSYTSLHLTTALLRLVVTGKDRPISECPLPSLDRLDLAALETIALYGLWEFVNYGGLVQSFGLPGTREALREYLENGPTAAALDQARRRARGARWF